LVFPNNLFENVCVLFDTTIFPIVFIAKSIFVGIIVQFIILNTKIRIGATKKIYESDLVGINNSLNTNLAPSATGCNNPHTPTTFGPLRL
jgi:hypothetical protein